MLYKDLILSSSLHLASDHTANNVMIKKGGILHVSDGGAATKTIVNSSGRVYVSNGGVVSNTTINSSGRMYISNGGLASETTVSGGYAGVASGGVVDIISVKSGGELLISSGGTALSIDWTPCIGNIEIHEGAVVSFESSYSGCYYGSYDELLSTGAIMSEKTVGFNGTLYVANNGTAISAMVQELGSMHVMSGGVIKDASVVGGESGKGYVYVSSGGTASSIIVSSGGYLCISSGGTAVNIDWTPCVGLVEMHDNATVSFKSSYSGCYFGRNNILLSSGEVISQKTVASNYVLYVMDGGTAESVSVSGEWIHGSANMMIWSGGTAENTTVENGDIYVSRGGAAYSTTVDSYGYLHVLTGGTACFTTVNEAGMLRVSSGGIVESTNIDYWGEMHVSSGGTASSTTVNEGGSMYVSSGGTASSTVVTDGYMYIEDSAVLRGSLTLNEYSNVSIYGNVDAEGMVLNLTLASLCTISELGKFTGLSSINLTVAGEMYGEYTLAYDIGDFSGYAVVLDEDGVEITVLEIGEEMRCSDKVYSLVSEDDSLTLKLRDASVAPEMDIMVSTDTPTNQPVVVTLAASDDFGEIKLYYSSDGINFEECSNEVEINSNGTFYFKAVDIDGNEVVSSCVIDNIDNVPPVIELTGDTITPLHNAILTASTEEGIAILYSIDNKQWTEYAGEIEVTANGTYYFKATDAAGNVGRAEIIFGNILEPEAPVIELVGDTTTPLQSTMLSATTEEGISIFYSQDNEQWTKYTGEIEVTTNGTYYFKATDAAGNVGTAEITFSNIDRIPPEIVLVGDTESPLQSAMLSATTESGAELLYSKDNEQWTEYTDEIEVTANGTYYFKATDAAGNVGTAEITFSNIDRIPPEIVLVGDTESPLQSTMLSATTESGAELLYSRDNEQWTEYTGEIEVTANGKYYFKATDAAGNVGTAEIIFSNIDRVPPEIVLVGDTESPLQSTMLSATTESGAELLYSKDNEQWTEYTGDIEVTANGTYYFKATDAAGNVGTAEIIFSNIDRSAPIIELTGDTITPLKRAMLSASTEEGLVILYSRDNEQWSEYTGEIEVAVNGTYYFKATDAAGNVGTAEITFNNIERIVIELTGNTAVPLQSAILSAVTEEGAELLYSRDNKQWSEYTGDIEVTENGTYYFKATNAAGNIGTAEITFNNIDRSAPIIELTGDTTTPLQSAMLSAATEAGAALLYSTDNELWSEYTGEINVNENITYYFKATDAAGNVGTAEITFNNIDKIAPVIELTGDTTTLLQSSKLSAITESGAQLIYSTDNELWCEYTGEIDVIANGTYYFKAIDAAGNVGTAEITFNNIDNVAPTLELAADIIIPTNQSVTLTATANDGKVEYFDGAKWVAGSEYTVFQNGIYRFRAIDSVGNIAEKSIEVTNIDRTPPANPEIFSEIITYYDVKLDWSDALDSGSAGIMGYYVRYGTSENLHGDGEFVEASEFELADLALGTHYYQVKTVDKAGNTSEWSQVLSFEIKIPQVRNLHGSGDGLTWDAVPDAEGYIVEYSNDGFENAMLIETVENRIDFYALPSGTYQWRIKVIGGDTYAVGEDIVISGTDEPRKLVSIDNGFDDIFFADARDVWNNDYLAQHLGISDVWCGTLEEVHLKGKNRLSDVFAGSSDANVLVMTDDANGDALFVDDIYTALGDGARVAQIDEIHAGAGDDIVDMTSQRVDYSGDGIIVHGGLGDDTIWANNGSNILFGDAGNDRLVGGCDNDIIIGGIGNDSMHGGGGDDIFVFCNGWGNDTVEQLEGGNVTLWFENNSGSWDLENLTYTCGENKVKVTGVSEVTLKFGNDLSEESEKLLSVNAFAKVSSENIFNG